MVGSMEVENKEIVCLYVRGPGMSQKPKETKIVELYPGQPVYVSVYRLL